MAKRSVQIGGGRGPIALDADDINYEPGTPGNWASAPDDVGAALDELAAHDAATQPYAFVYRPGGVAGDNVYTDWPALYAVLATVQGPKIILIDDSITSPVVIPAGTYDVDNVTFTGTSSYASATGGARLTLADGVHFTGGVLTFTGWLNVLGEASSGAVVTLTAGMEFNLTIDQFAVLNMAGAGRFVKAGAGSYCWVNLVTGGIGDGTHAVIEFAGAATGQTNGRENSSIHGNAIATSNGGTWESFVSSGSEVETPQGSGGTLTYTDLAGPLDPGAFQGVGYTPSTPGNWSPAPAQVAAALDQLAAARTSAWADDQGPFGAIPASPNWAALPLVTNFTVSTSKTAVSITAIWTNATGTSRTMIMGVAAVPTGSAAPTTPDYAFAATHPTVPANTAINYPLNVMYGAGGDAPAALPAGAYDFYVMAQASAALAVQPAGVQMEVRNV